MDATDLNSRFMMPEYPQNEDHGSFSMLVMNKNMKN